jgi:hypothetical protein
VHESPELVALLSQVDLDGQIPPQLYVAVAELLAWIYRVEREGALPEGLISRQSRLELASSCSFPASTEQ